MILKQYFTYQNLFQINGAYVTPQEKLFLAFGAVLVLLAVVLKISSVLAPSPVDSKYRQKFYSLFLSIGLAALAWYGCRYENVMFFGSHFVAFLLVLVGLIWFASLIVSAYKNYSREKSSWSKEQVKLRYLPK